MTARFLEKQSFPHADIRLRILTTSQDADFQKTVREWLAQCDYPEPQFEVVDFAPAGLADRHRPHYGDEVREVCARIYARLAAKVTTRLVFTLEDDVLPPVDVYSRLEKWVRGDVVSASGLYHGRYVADPIAWVWSAQGKPVTCKPANGAQNVGGHGMGAAVFAGEIFQSERFHAGLPHHDFDYNFFHRLILEEKKRAMLDTDCLCRHYSAEGEWVQTPQTALALRLLLGATAPLSIVHLNAYDHHGGAERLAHDLFTSQEKAGHRSVTLVGRKTKPESAAIAFPRDPDMSQRDRLQAEGWPDYEFRGSHRLVEHPVVRKAGVIHLHNSYGGYLHPFSLIALSQSRPLVWSIHDMQAITGYCSHSLDCRRWQTGCGNCPDLTLPGPWLPFDNTAALWRDKKLISDNSRLWIVGASDWMVANLQRSLLSAHPIRKIPNGIHTEVFRPSNRQEMRAKLGLPQDALIVGSLARSGILAHPWKGGPHARIVLEALRLEHPNLLFLNLGSSKETGEPWIRDIAPDSDESLREHLGALDFFLYPSIADTAPLAVLEALACGLPVAAFQIGGIPDMVRPNEEGFLAPEGDTAALVLIAQKLARDAELRRRLGASARDRAIKHFDVQHMADAYERLYHEAIVTHAGKDLPSHTAPAPPPKTDSKRKETRPQASPSPQTSENTLRHLVRHPRKWLAAFPTMTRNWLKKSTLQDPTIASASDVLDFILELLHHHRLRTQFPTALTDGSDGPFAAWLVEKLTTARRSRDLAAQWVSEAFAHPATRSVVDLYLRRPQLWAKFPDALVSPAHKSFLNWLKKTGTERYSLSTQAIAWFALETGEHPPDRLVFTYLLLADWQKQHPHALQPTGAKPFLQWIAEKKITAPTTPAVFLRTAARWQTAAANHIPETSSTPPSATQSGTQTGINVLGLFCYPSGLGEVAFQTVRTARVAGFATSCRDISIGAKASLGDRRPFLGTEIYPTSIIQLTPSPFYETAYARAGLHRTEGIRRIGVVSWELPDIPWPWLIKNNWLDEVWAPTRFIKDALDRAGVAHTHLVLPSVELSPFDPLPRSDFGLPDDDLLYLFMFDMSSSLGRKNPLGLIAAFRLAFPEKNTGPHLVIKVSHGSSDPLGLERLRQAASENNILLLDEVMTRARSYALLAVADAYISLHRSEGFGLSLAEAMLMGKPVIATNYSGNLDFMHPGNSLLVESHGLIAVGQDAQPNYPSQGRWADPDLTQAAAHLRWIAENPVAARALGDRARNELQTLLSLPAAAARLKARLG